MLKAYLSAALLEARRGQQAVGWLSTQTCTSFLSVLTPPSAMSSAHAGSWVILVQFLG